MTADEAELVRAMYLALGTVVRELERAYDALNLIENGVPLSELPDVWAEAYVRVNRAYQAAAEARRAAAS